MAVVNEFIIIIIMIVNWIYRQGRNGNDGDDDDLSKPGPETASPHFDWLLRDSRIPGLGERIQLSFDLECLSIKFGSISGEQNWRKEEKD